MPSSGIEGPRQSPLPLEENPGSISDEPGLCGSSEQSHDPYLMNEISIRLEVGESNKRCYRKQKELFYSPLKGTSGKSRLIANRSMRPPHEQ